MNIVSVYRVFRTRAACVYERELSDMAVLAIENATTRHIQWMLETPTVFTKSVTPTLANELAVLPFHQSLDDLIFIIEAYPLSSHHGPVSELGILISINRSFRVGKSANQRNWMYDHCYIVHKKDWRTHVFLKDLPKTFKH